MPAMRILAHFLSLVFHPLIILTYMLLILLLINPFLFGANSVWDNSFLILRVFATTFVIPAVAVVMMRLLEMIPSLQMEERRDRNIPYIATGIFYLWMFQSIYDVTRVPMEFKVFVLGAVMALFLAFFLNLFTKISIHAVGMGGLIGMISITMVLFSYNTFTLHFLGNMYDVSINLVLFLGLLVAGLVCSSRLMLNAHHMQDLYGGFIVGLSTQFIALNLLY